MCNRNQPLFKYLEQLTQYLIRQYLMKGPQLQSLKSKALYYKQSKELLHIACIRIPFFLSAIKPTSIIAISTNNHQSVISKIVLDQRNSNQYQKFRIDRNQIMLKTYYPSGTIDPKHTVIIIFSDLQTAKQFYLQYNKLPNLDTKSTLCLEDPSENKFLESQSNIKKIRAFYCKDVSNYSEIFFNSSKNYIAYPESQDLKQLVNIVSKMVIVQGLPLQQALKSKKIPLLSFMDQKSYSTQHMYYRWRTFSYMQGDGDKKFRTQKFLMMNGGSQWFPPTQRTAIRILNSKERAYFTRLVAKLTTKKSSIQEAMCFCIKNMGKAVQIVEIISIWVFQNPVPLFMLISDIFFNTSTPIYRNFFSVLLPKLAYQLSPTLINSNLERIKSIIQLWISRYIYQEQYLKGIMFVFDHPRGEIDYSQQSGIQVNEQIKQTQIQMNCHNYGIPYFQKNPRESQKILKKYRSIIKSAEQNVPNIGLYDGEQIAEKQIAKIKAKSVKAFVCSNTNIGMLFQKKKNIQ